MIELKNVSFFYGEREILSDFSLRVENGQCVCLKGYSGCGKTTVLRLVLGLEEPAKGEVVRPEKPAVVFQEDRLIPSLTLKKNVLLPLEKEKYKSALELIKEAGLGEALNKRVVELSGGMKRRAAIVRAVAFGGDALILDEPFNGIDAENREIMAKMIKREFTEKGKPVLMVSHIPSDAELLNSTVAEM